MCYDVKDKKIKEMTEKIRCLLNEKEMSLKELYNSISDLSEQETLNILNVLFDNDKIKKFGNKYQWKG